MTYDPFLRSIVIIANRTILFVVVAAFVSALLWGYVCKHALEISHVDAVTTAVGIVFGRSEPVFVALFVLTLTSATLATAFVAGALFWLWRRRAELAGRHVRGPRIRGDA
jgi:hypothetical protein